MLANDTLSLTSPDEVFYAQTAKEMSRINSWQVPYLFGKPQFEKPILTFWLLRIAFALFGISSFSARFFPAIFASLGVIAVYFLGIAGFKNERKAFIASLLLMSSGLYVGLARTVFTDLIFSVFILLSLASFFWGYSSEKKVAGLLLFFIFSGLAVITKGPLGFLVPFLTVALFLIVRKDLKFLLCECSLWGLFAFALISLPWYVFMINKYGQSFIHEFFYNDHIRRIIEAEHAANDTWYFYPFSAILCIFPWGLFVAASSASLAKHLRYNKEPFYLFLACWICAVFAIFQFAHSKLVSYIFPFFPALALIAADFINDKLLVNKPSRLALTILLISSLALLLFPLAISIIWVKYPFYISSYLPSKIPVYYLATVFIGLVISILFFILRNKLLKSIYALTLVVPLLLSVVPFVRNNIEPYLSSKKACEYLLNNYSVDNTILCSKPFVRGVKYYTDKEIAVVEGPRNNFFSPHPILFLGQDERTRDFLHNQSVTYGIIKKSTVRDMERIKGNDFKFTILKILGNQYIVKIEELTQQGR